MIPYVSFPTDIRQSHTVPKIGTMCNDFHFSCCVNHTRFALANRRPQNSLWDRKPSPPNSKKKNKTLTIPTSQKPSPRSPPPPVRSPFTPAQAPPRLCHGTAYHGGKYLARRLPPPPGCWQSPLHFATSTCRRLSPSTFSTLLVVDPAPLGWGICRTEGSFSWMTR